MPTASRGAVGGADLALDQGKRGDSMKRHPWVVTCSSLAMALTFTTAMAATPASMSAQDRNGTVQQRGDQRGDQRGNQQDHRRFDDHDRQVSRDWYNQHQRSLPMGFRDRDRLPNRYNGELREGWVIDRGLRAQIHVIPSALLRLLTPAPRGFRYVALDGNIVLIDGSYRVYDVMSIGR
jgi:hypothetical protein